MSGGGGGGGDAMRSRDQKTLAELRVECTYDCAVCECSRPLRVQPAFPAVSNWINSKHFGATRLIANR